MPYFLPLDLECESHQRYHFAYTGWVEGRLRHHSGLAWPWRQLSGQLPGNEVFIFEKLFKICIVGNSEPLVGMIWPMRPGNLLVCTLWAQNASPPRAFVGTRGMEVNVAYPERTTIHS